MVLPDSWTVGVAVNKEKAKCSDKNFSTFSLKFKSLISPLKSGF